MGSLSLDGSGELTLPSYPGEDTRPTSKKELLGFYTYSFAGEAFVVCGLGAFIPIFLEELARDSPTAVLANDHSQPCKANGIAISNFRRQSPTAPGSENQCVFQFFGAEINTASFAMYTFSVSVLLQAFVVVTMSGAADHGQYRKKLLLSFATVGAISTMLFLPVTPEVYLFGSLWAILGNVCFGASFVLLNSFLPLLVRHHPATKGRHVVAQETRSPEFHDNGEGSDDHHSEDPTVSDIIDPSASLLPQEHLSRQSSLLPSEPSADMQLSTKISSYGVGIGFVAAVTVQIISIVILKATGATLFSLRIVLFVIGLWWLCFTIPAGLWLRSRPGPPLSFGKHATSRGWFGYVTFSWANLGRTMLRARRLKDVLLFLGAWFMISDADATISGTAILFAKTTLGMDSSALALINVIVTLCGIAGAFAWPTISHMLKLKPSQTILVCICLLELIPIYGLLGYIPAIQRLGMFGLQQQWEMYPLGAIFGIVLGGIGSYCRSLFGELIPPGSEAAFYALYAITDKGSSVFGPAIVGVITDATGDIRPAFWFLAALIALPIPLLVLVDADRGKREAAALARETIPEANISETLSPTDRDGNLNDTGGYEQPVIS